MKNNYFAARHHKQIAGAIRILTLFICLFISYTGLAQKNAGGTGNTLEKKVDYLEQLYFSGENKEGLTNKMTSVMDNLVNIKPATKAVAGQYFFLNGIKEQTDKAKDACEILDLLAVGIYQLDAIEAQKQSVKAPSDEAKKKAASALELLVKLDEITTQAGEVADLVDVKVPGLKPAAAVTGTAVQAKEMDSLKKKDKPCADVKQRDIEIGEHVSQGKKG